MVVELSQPNAHLCDDSVGLLSVLHYQSEDSHPLKHAEEPVAADDANSAPLQHITHHKMCGG